VSGPEVLRAADADSTVLEDAAETILAVGRHEGIDWVDALGPPEGVVAALRAGLEPGHDVLLAVDPGRAVTLAQLGTDANLERASFEAYVRPEHRGRGVARSLLSAVMRAAAEHGRTVAAFTTPRGGTGDAALSSLPTLRQVQLERESVWEATDEWRAVAALARAEALPSADAYELRHWIGDTPEDLVPSFADALVAMEDAPLGDSSWRPPPSDEDAVRRRDAFVADAGLTHHVLAALHRDTGTIGGFTDIALWPGHDRGEQWDTGVVRAHRGHRLGMMLKAEMVGILADHEPRLRRLHTWNADENTHMLAINDRLGWRLRQVWVASEGDLRALAT
jgi:GNAT superfamily N-acetyltransferase